MADYQEHLSTLDGDPHNAQALSALVRLAAAGGDKGGLAQPNAAHALDEARKTFRERGEMDLVARLYDVELAATGDRDRRADLLLEKGRLLYEELFDETEATECLQRVLELRPEDAGAQELLAHIGLVRANWQKIVKKYLEEARVSTDRQLSTRLYLSVAESYARNQPDAPEVETYLRKALEVEPRNRLANAHLERLLRKAGRWAEVAELLSQRVDGAGSKEERVQALLALADVSRARLDKADAAVDAMKKILAVEPAHPRALAALIDAYTAAENWSALVKVYEGALKARQKQPQPQEELGLYLQIAMIYWKRLAQMDAAEEYFRRIRKLDGSHPAMVDFYRAYHKDRGDGQKLLAILQQALKGEKEPERRRELASEVASLAESEVGNPEKAIDSWKAILRQDAKNPEARAALKRLYLKTEKWNALLELLKEEVEQIPAERKPERVERLMEVVAIYRDRLHLDVMVINTYNSILALAPDHVPALDALSQKYEQLGRWNDLITVLQRKADAPGVEPVTRAALLRRIAALWTDRFGNQAQAVKPLEELLALEPGDAAALAKLKEIYSKRRQWRALLDLMARELDTLPDDTRRPHLSDMARLASDKLGDLRASIAVWNRILERNARDAEALAALVSLYEKEKRFAALAEILHRQRELETEPRAQVALLEKLGALYADRLAAPALAAQTLSEVLKVQPGHPKAVRVLRDLYAHMGNLDALEELYLSIGAWDDLIEVLHGVADRAPETSKKLDILGRIARLAGNKLGAPEKAVRAYERILAIDPQNLDAANALVPIYRKAEKWARLLGTYEVLLGHAQSPADKLALHLDIRKLAEEKLGSKALAFQWAARAYELATAAGLAGDDRFLRDLERLGAEADSWGEVAGILERRLAAPDVAPAERLRLLRELGRIRAVRLHKIDDARGAWAEVMKLAPDDPEAMSALEDLATQQGRWTDLLAIYRRRAELEKEKDKKLELLYKIAFIDEDRAGNLESAARTYEQILEMEPKSQRAIRALVKVQAGRGDAAGLARALELELGETPEPEARVALFLRLGALYEDKLADRRKGLDRYVAALQAQPSNRQVHSALEKFLAQGSAERVEVARLLSPVYDRSADTDAESAARLAQTLEILREAEPDAKAKLALDRRLGVLYARRLRDPLNGYDAAGRVLQAAPEDADNRRDMAALAAELAALDDLAVQLERVLAAKPSPIDDRVRRDIAAELADIYERLEKPKDAEGAWRRVLAVDPTDERAYAALERLLRDAERWDDLRGVLEQRVAHAAGEAKKRDILLSICDLYEGVLDNAEGAVEAYRRVLDLDPTSVRAYKALERLYDRAEKWPELEALLARELTQIKDDREIVALTFRRAALRSARLGDPHGAVDLAEEVLARDPRHPGARALLESLFGNAQLRLRIARTLGPKYEADGQWDAQIRMLQGEREFTRGSTDSVELLARVAGIQEERLGDEAAAFATWREAVITDPKDVRARESVERLARGLDRWNDAAATLEQAAATEGDVALRATLLSELGRMYDGQLGDAKRATAAYRRLIDVDPQNRGQAIPAAEALERLYAEEEAWPQLIDILRRQAEWADTPERRVACLVRAAGIQEGKLDDSAAAVATWREVLHEDPDSAEALDSLERLHYGRGEARELIDILNRRVALATAPADKRELLWRVAGLQEKDLAAPPDAIIAYLEVLDFLPDDRETLAELARLYRAGERWADLLDVNERRLGHADTARERAALRFELGELLSGKLRRPEEALERFRQILVEDAGNDAALTAVERFLGDDALKLRAAEILQPIYEGRGDHAKLVDLYELEAKAVDDPRERLARLRKVADIRERFLADPDGALDAHARAAREALAELELKDHLASLERLAVARDRIGDLVALYRELAPQILDGELQRRLYLDTADLARGKLGDLALAREYYRRVLDANQEDARALSALESLYRQTGEHEPLREILHRKADLAGEDIDVRRDALAEIAVLAEEKLGHPEESVAAWEEILEILPADAEATKALERLYAARERWVELAELLERRMGYAEDITEAVALRFRLGELYETKLSDPDKSVDNYQAALGGDPQHAGSIAALERFLGDAGVRLQVAEVLEPVYIGRQDWPNLIRITEIRLDATADADKRLALTRRIARLYEEQLEDLDGAFRWYGKVFREDPDERATRDQLVRLATVLERWDGLANIYQELLDDETGDRPAVLEVARSLGDIYDRRLGDVERARAAYRRVLQANPQDRDTFERLEAMLARGTRWFALIEAYEEALEAAVDDGRRKELHYKVAEVQEKRLVAVDRAIDAYRAVLDIDPDDAVAVTELDRLYQEQKRWADLAELLTGRIDRTPDPAAVRVRLAGVLEQKLNEVGSAIDQHAEVLAVDGPPHPEALAALERLVRSGEHRHRIAQILEPIYRRQDWWQKLVVILDAQLEYVDDVAQRVSMLREIARLHEERGQRLPDAMRALARAWREDVSDEEVYGELQRVATSLEAWDDLTQTLDAGVEGVYDYDLAARLLARIGRIEEEKRGDRTRAIAAWRRVLEVKEDDLDALSALERLHELEGQWEPLAKVLERRVELTDDSEERKRLHARIARLLEEKLGRRDAAISSYRQVLAHDDRDAAALDALERLYRHAKDYRALAEILAQKIELAPGDAERRPLRFTAAAVHDNELHDPFEAIVQYKAVLDADPNDGEALEAVGRLYEREKSFTDLVETLDRRAELAVDPVVKADLLHRAARIVEVEQSEPGQAIDRYARILEQFPRHVSTRDALEALTRDEDALAAAADALEPVYRADGLYDKVAELYDKRLAARGADTAMRREQVDALARVHETGRRDPQAAFQTWARFLKDEPEDVGAQTELERLAHDRGRWADLAALYEDVLGATSDGELGRFYALKLAQIYEEALGDLDRAASRYRKALDLVGEEMHSLAALDRIFERQQKWTDLAEILGREALVAATDEEQATFLYRLGDLRERILGDPRGAVEAYRDVLERVPTHEAARAALERLLGNPTERAAVIAILEPIYDREGDHARLADLFEHKLTVENDPLDRASLLGRLVDLAERKLGDRTRALDAAGRWLAEDPSSEEAAEELSRLAEAQGRWEEAAARLHDVARAAGRPEIERDLELRRGKVLLDAVGDARRAEEPYRRALDLDPQNGAALAALDRIYRALGDDAKLAAILWRRAEVEFDAQNKRDHFAEAGRLREERLADDPGAIEAWRHVVDLNEGDAEAHARLAALYERAGKWEELVDVLDTAARFAEDKPAELALRQRSAEVLTHELRAYDRAVDAWITVADLAPEDDEALQALADVHRRRQDWLAVQETLVRRAALAKAMPARVAIFKQLSQLAENERQSPDEAVGYLYQVLDESPHDAYAFDSLERILGGHERWNDLVDVLERRAEADPGNAVALLARAADIWESKLGNADAAGELLEKILAREPGYVPALTRLARIYEAAGDWEKCEATLGRALALRPVGRDAADLYFRLARVQENKAGDPAAGMPHIEQALAFDPLHPEALPALERLVRDRGEWARVAEILKAREAAEADPKKRHAAVLELAAILRDRLGRPAEAVPYLERAAALAPDDTATAETLADVYFAAGRSSDAEPLYKKLSDAARAARKPKDVARYAQRLGALREAAGDAAAALPAYEEAYKIDPQNGAVMAGLGRLYMSVADWEKARRVYRSMLLQNLDPSVGVSKADVYLQLGLIHAKLGEAPKAKSMYERGLELDPGHAGLKAAMAEVK